MKTLEKEDFTISISGNIAEAVQKYYERDDYSLMVENFFKLVLPKQRKRKESLLPVQLRGCAALSGLTDKTDKEIKEIMYKDKYRI